MDWKDYNATASWFWPHYARVAIGSQQKKHFFFKCTLNSFEFPTQGYEHISKPHQTTFFFLVKTGLWFLLLLICLFVSYLFFSTDFFPLIRFSLFSELVETLHCFEFRGYISLVTLDMRCLNISLFMWLTLSTNNPSRTSCKTEEFVVLPKRKRMNN